MKSNNTDHRTDQQIAYVDQSHNFLCEAGEVLGLPMPEYRYAVPQRVREVAEALAEAVDALDEGTIIGGSHMHEKLKRALGSALWRERQA
jgi:hypothetical protein